MTTIVCSRYLLDSVYPRVYPASIPVVPLSWTRIDTGSKGYLEQTKDGRINQHVVDVMSEALVVRWIYNIFHKSSRKATASENSNDGTGGEWQETDIARLVLKRTYYHCVSSTESLKVASCPPVQIWVNPTLRTRT